MVLSGLLARFPLGHLLRGDCYMAFQHARLTQKRLVCVARYARHRHCILCGLLLTSVFAAACGTDPGSEVDASTDEHTRTDMDDRDDVAPPDVEHDDGDAVESDAVVELPGQDAERDQPDRDEDVSVVCPEYRLLCYDSAELWRSAEDLPPGYVHQVSPIAPYTASCAVFPRAETDVTGTVVIVSDSGEEIRRELRRPQIDPPNTSGIYEMSINWDDPCPVAPTTYEVLPWPVDIDVVFELIWEADDGRSVVDLDLLVSRDLTQCSPNADAHFYSFTRPGESDWGVIGDPDDDPRTVTRDVNNFPFGREATYARMQSPDESWSVVVVPRTQGVHATAELVVIVAGVEIARTERAIYVPRDLDSSEGRPIWLVGVRDGSNRAEFELTDALTRGLPMCNSSPVFTCPDGTMGTFEICDGIDNNCNGIIDEMPRACDGWGPASEGAECVQLPDSGTFRCIQP